MFSKRTQQELIEAKTKLLAQLEHITSLLNGDAPTRKPRHLSPEGIERIRTAQKKRWAKSKKPLHWTQRPENAARVKRHLAKMRKAR